MIAEIKEAVAKSWFLHTFQDILEFIKQAQERVLSHHEEQALLKAYIAEWRKFFPGADPIKKFLA